MDPYADRPVEKPAILASRNENTLPRPAPPPPPPKMPPIESAVDSNMSTMTNGTGTSRRGKGEMKVNNRTYQRLMLLGKGGSSRVYKVMTDAGKFFALKKVTFHKEDGEAAIAGYKGEIQLLNKLAHVERVIKLWDSEINDRKQCLLMLMECGETDLAKLLSEKNNARDARLDIHFVRYYWKEMLECVKAVHEVNIIHSDLKPANFLLVQGRLKLIDFGIANAIQDDTVNVHRESQVGTVNYMAPETLQDVNRQSGRGGAKLHKLGAPSDVWSLGCILYQMIYGKTPFAHVTSIFDKVKAITNPEYPVEYPPTGIGGAPVPLSAIQCMRACLRREKERRPTINELLSDEDRFMNPDHVTEGMADISADTIRALIKNAADYCSQPGNEPPNDEQLNKWAAQTFIQLQKQMYDGRAGCYSR
ncbi:kinase-like protein [Ascobolus immersus RN42]|uniref:Kinase-like protein n=1 Tax=Ascobolus immersus RN42 TaxID=1160509 RepID=A0A3N4HXC5_ASCIM|nr:kinase-like protein [Ascobolus immersus RN42]